MKEEIDLVYLWVDGSDPVWQKKRDTFIGKTAEDSAENCEGRYADNDELRYSLRSVERYAPWIRRIFIVTDAQTPSWLDTSNPRIRVVDHTEILPREALPTFNSVVIEHRLHLIPGLSEYFLYANDDMFFNREVSPGDFFTPDGRPIIRLNRRPFRRLSLLLKEKILGRKTSTYNRTILKAANLVKERYGKFIGGKTHHNIDAYRKSYNRETYETFEAAISPTLLHHERSADDIQRNLYSYSDMVNKRGEARYVGSKTSFKFHIDNPAHYEKLERLRPMLFCLNDSQYATDADRRRVGEYLRRRFPEPSEFEVS